MSLLNLLRDDPLTFLFVATALLFSIAVHEFSHAFVADRLGDPTPRIDGRLTLNPIAHLDPMGTLLILFLGLGWGKPVQFDPFNLRNPRRDAALISLAGPVSNFTIAFFASLILRTFSLSPLTPLGQILTLLVYFSLLLGLFNLIPIHPLDGFKVVVGFLPKHLSLEWLSFEKYGLFILLLVLFFPIGSPLIFQLIGPILSTLFQLFTGFPSL